MEDKGWTNKDWKWLIRILIGIIGILALVIITITAIKLSNNVELVNVISIGAGLVSMVVGIIAIIYAFIQTKESGEQNSQLRNTMNQIDKRIYKLDDIIKQINTVQYEIQDFKYTSTDKFDDLADLMIDIKNSNEYKKLDENDKVRKDIDILYEELDNIFDQLTPVEEKVLRLRFGFNDGMARSLEEVGTEFSVTKEKIRQIEAKALRKLGTIFLREKLNGINKDIKNL